jgi:hypothetical protein
MTIKYLKKGIDEQQRSQDNEKVKKDDVVDAEFEEIKEDNKK